jgi:phosphoribosylformimino-5-aminoimidazole carboxamide ribotide isomerase
MTTGACELYPAIDLRGGRVVRLSQGDYGRETVYGDDPRDTAMSFVDAGATWVHIVDLDAARGDGPVNRAAVESVASALAGRALLQVGGGVRSAEDARHLAGLGVHRVVMGSAAVADPETAREASLHVEVAVGLDHRGGEVAVQGWTRSAGRSVEELLPLYPFAASFIVTDIARDGMLVGPDTDGLAAVCGATRTPVVASGGVASLGDLHTLRAVPGIAGVIVGRALYEGRFGVAEALAALGGPV